MTRGKHKPGLSLERHKEIGMELAQIHNRLVQIAVEVSNAYPVKSKAGQAADAFFTLGRGTIYVDKLRFALENEMFTEHDGKDGCNLHAYCGNPDHQDGTLPGSYCPTR
jgi:hypothetical protein